MLIPYLETKISPVRVIGQELLIDFCKTHVKEVGQRRASLHNSRLGLNLPENEPGGLVIKNNIKTIGLGIIIILILVVIYFSLLSALIAPFLFSLDQTLNRIAQKEQARQAMDKTIPLAKQEQILLQRFGKTISHNEIYAQKRIIKAWRSFCALAFALFAFGTWINFVAGIKENRKGHPARHVTFLPALAFTLPILLFNEQALNLIKPLGIASAAIFIATVFITNRLRKKEDAGKPDNE